MNEKYLHPDVMEIYLYLKIVTHNARYFRRIIESDKLLFAYFGWLLKRVVGCETSLETAKAIDVIN